MVVLSNLDGAMLRMSIISEASNEDKDEPNKSEEVNDEKQFSSNK